MATLNDGSPESERIGMSRYCDSLEARIAALEARLQEWEKWFGDLQADFGGVTDNCLDPSRVHDWNWIANYRPSPDDAKQG